MTGHIESPIGSPVGFEFTPEAEPTGPPGRNRGQACSKSLGMSHRAWGNRDQNGVASGAGAPRVVDRAGRSPQAAPKSSETSKVLSSP